jgi:hypothetical protein
LHPKLFGESNKLIIKKQLIEIIEDWEKNDPPAQPYHIVEENIEENMTIQL